MEIWGPTIEEEANVDVDDFRLLLEDKINPIRKDILRLEQSSFDILEILKTQVRQDEIIRNIQKDATINVTVHDEIFRRLREINTSQGECKLIESRINTLEDQNNNSNKKIWDVVKLLLAGSVGGLVHWWVKK